MKTGFSLMEILHRENPVLITGMGLQCSIFLSPLNFMKEEACIHEVSGEKRRKATAHTIGLPLLLSE